MPWAPPSQAIPRLVMPGLAANQAEYLRMEAEAMRRGASVHEYRKAEVAGKLTPPSSPKSAQPEPVQIKNTVPIPVEVVRAPDPKPTVPELPAAPPYQPPSRLDRYDPSLSTTTAPDPVKFQPAIPPTTQPDVPTTAPPTGNPQWVQHLIDGIAGANRHVLIEGQSGSGKSIMARHIAFERMAKGEEVHVVDPGHGTSTWKGAASVFGADTAGTDAAEFLKETLASRKKQKGELEAALGREAGTEDFKPMTIVFSDFKKLMQDFPKLATELNAMLQEARKFNIAVLAEAASISGIKGVDSMRTNFAQHVKMLGATATDPQRRAIVGDTTEDTPNLPLYKDRFDPSIVRKPTVEPPPEPEVFDPMKLARARIEAEERQKQVEDAYKSLKPPDPKPVVSFFEALLDFAQGVRGTLGGTLGATFGALLDITSAVRKFRRGRAEAAKDAPRPPSAIPVDAPPSAIPVPESERAPVAPVASVVPTAQVAKAEVGAGEAASGMAKLAAAAGVAAAVVTGMVKAFNAVVGEANNMAEKYGEYNPEIAQAQAMAEIRKITGDMRRAQESSGELAAFIQAQSEMQDRWENVKTAIMKKLIPVVTGILEILSRLLNIVDSKDAERVDDPTSLLLNTNWFDRAGQDGGAPRV